MERDHETLVRKSFQQRYRCKVKFYCDADDRYLLVQIGFSFYSCKRTHLTRQLIHINIITGIVSLFISRLTDNNRT